MNTDSSFYYPSPSGDTQGMEHGELDPVTAGSARPRVPVHALLPPRDQQGLLPPHVHGILLQCRNKRTHKFQQREICIEAPVV